MNPVTETVYDITDKTPFDLPNTEAALNTYLNDTYYNSLPAEAKALITNSNYRIGVLRRTSGNTLETEFQEVNNLIWNGKVGLIDATEYVRASVNSLCIRAYDYYSTAECYNSPNNYLYLSDFDLFTITPFSYDNSGYIWRIQDTGRLMETGVSNERSIRPVVTLASNAVITGGTGTSTDAFVLS